MNKLLLVTIFLALVATGYSSWIKPTSGHEYTVAASKEIAEGIKKELLANIDQITDDKVKKELTADLNQSDDSKRTLKSIDAVTVQTILDIFKIKGSPCKAEQLTGAKNLQCLNIIWKSYVPK